MTSAARFALAARFAAAQGRTEVIPFPGYLAAGFDAAVIAHPVAATFTFDADDQPVALIRAEDREALAVLAAAVA